MELFGSESLSWLLTGKLINTTYHRVGVRLVSGGFFNIGFDS